MIVTVLAKVTPEDSAPPSVGKQRFMILSMALPQNDESTNLSDLVSHSFRPCVGRSHHIHQPWRDSHAEKEGSADVHRTKLGVKFLEPEKKRSKPLPLISIDPYDYLAFQRRARSPFQRITYILNAYLYFCSSGPLTRRIEQVLVVMNLHHSPIAIKVKMNNIKVRTHVPPSWCRISCADHTHTTTQRYTARPNLCRLTPGQPVQITSTFRGFQRLQFRPIDD